VGLSQLKIVTVALECDPDDNKDVEAELEAKVSSSNFRKKLLGKF
jgi:hypothetical protein